MSKIKEMVETSSMYFEYENDKYEVYRLMKEYAEYYVRQYRDLVENNMMILDNGESLILKSELLKIKLPNHE